MKYTIFVGLDVHEDTIAVATIYPGSLEAEFLGTIPNNPDAIRKLIKKLGDSRKIQVCYEAGPCGYVIYRQLTQMGVSCLVAAPSLIPTKPGDRIKTDKRDAKKLAKLLRNGDLTPVWLKKIKFEETSRQIVITEYIYAVEQAQEKIKRYDQAIEESGLRLPRGYH